MALMTPEQLEGALRQIGAERYHNNHPFHKRLTQAPRDANFALDYAKREARRPDQQRAVLDALLFKCNVLWAQLDALQHAYDTPGQIPPGAFVPEAA